MRVVVRVDVQNTFGLLVRSPHPTPPPNTHRHLAFVCLFTQLPPDYTHTLHAPPPQPTLSNHAHPPTHPFNTPPLTLPHTALRTFWTGKTGSCSSRLINPQYPMFMTHTPCPPPPKHRLLLGVGV